MLIAISNGCKSSGENQSALKKEVDEWLDNYNKEWQKLKYESAKAQWRLNTYIVDGDSLTAKKATKAEKAFAVFTGSVDNINKAKKYLKQKNKLTDIQVKQLQAILYMAGGSPEVAINIVTEKIKLRNEQVKKLYNYKYTWQGKNVSTNTLDSLLVYATDIETRLAAWQESKKVGQVLKPGMPKLVELRNKTVQALDYDNYFAYQASEYGWNSDELLEKCNNMIQQIWPLYRQLHTWTRYTLAEKYNKPVPDYLPAHWLPNRWGQEWAAMLNVKGLDPNDSLQTKTAEWIVKTGEEFYRSLGFPALPESFYEKSSLYPLPINAKHSKNNHASAWHLNSANDVRSLMSVEPNTQWWETTLHELGHIYYYITYSNSDVPIILREGANRAFHEAMGSLIGLASMQTPLLQTLNLIPDSTVLVNDTLLWLREALNYVVLIPWSAGVMTQFEHALYSQNLPSDKYNAKWWTLKKKYQGIAPPGPRGSEFADALSKTHITDDPSQYYDYAMSNILLFQFHVFIANRILEQDPHATNYWGSKETGDFLRKLMYPGASVNWQTHLKNSIGSPMSADAMVEYFKPLMQWLEKQNAGRTITLPKKFPE